MPMAPANFATRRPTLPTPTMPSVLPPSSLLPTRERALQSPLRVALSIANVRLTHVSISISACSATACEFEPGACTTAMPQRVAAGMSTVSSPTPCRPITFRFGQAAIRLSVQRGLVRKRMPWAPDAILTNASSVSSSHRITSTSRSSWARPSWWVGPARTTTLRDSAIRKILLSLGGRILLYPGQLLTREPGAGHEALELLGGHPARDGKEAAVRNGPQLVEGDELRAEGQPVGDVLGRLDRKSVV